VLDLECLGTFKGEDIFVFDKDVQGRHYAFLIPRFRTSMGLLIHGFGTLSLNDNYSRLSGLRGTRILFKEPVISTAATVGCRIMINTHRKGNRRT
jgi:hypothetical protein